MYNWVKFSAVLLVAKVTARFTAISSEGAESIDLGGQWKAQNRNGSISIDANVPGLIQTDLHAAGVLPDPFIDKNFEQYDWVPQEDWIFSRSLPPTSPEGREWSSFKKVFLIFDGIDTAASIAINGREVGVADNMYRQWTYDISEAVSKQGNLTLEVDIRSPIKYALEVFESTGSPYTIFPNYAVQYPEGRQYIRKVQSDFGWDWGPHFAPSGIYRDVYIVGLDNGFYVTNSFIDIYKTGQRPNTIPEQSNPWVINASVDYLSAGGGVGLSLSIDIAGHSESSNSNSTRLQAGQNSASVLMEIPDSVVDRWWPKTFGNPKLYDASIKLHGASNITAAYSKKVGFRTIVLDLSPYDDREGNHWSFQINGQPFNAKGTNLVPVNPFEHTVTTDQYRRLIEASVASNYNIIRVWSSGNYYSDVLYEAADELGILMWNEFQFSDNYYPVIPNFLETVREETMYQIRRLNHHPSSALWCGGNELAKFRKVGLRNETYGESWATNLTIIQDHTLWPIVYDNTRSISWIQSSDGQGYVSYNPETGSWISRNGTDSPYYGSLMDYNLALDTVFNNSYLPATRFSVEYGMMSYDSLHSYRTVFDDENITENGTMLLNRCYDGGLTIYPDTRDGIDRFLILPQHSDEIKQFDQFSWTSQIWQGEIIKFKTESYRRSISLPENNMGALVWQLNAPWTTLALNTIEYTGRWKVSQYVTKQAFDPVVVSSWFEPTNETYNIWIASDTWEATRGTVTASWYNWEGEALSSETYDFSLGPLDSAEVVSLAGWRNILPPSASIEKSVLILKLEAQECSGKRYRSQNHWVPDYLSSSSLVDPGLEIEYLGNLQWRVKATKGTAAYVWLTEPAGVIGYFDDNSIFMVKGESRTFRYYLQEGPADDCWGESVTVRSIWDNIA